MNPFRRLLDLVRNPSNTRTVGILAVLVIALAIPLTVNIAQKQQELRQHAASNRCATNDPCSGWNYGTCTTNDGQPGHLTTCPEQGINAGCIAGPTPDLSQCTPAQANCAAKGGVCSNQGCNSGQTTVGICAFGVSCCADTLPTPSPAISCSDAGNGFYNEPCTEGRSDQYRKEKGPGLADCPAGQCSIRACFKNPKAANFCWYDNGTCYPFPDAATKCTNPATPTPTPTSTPTPAVCITDPTGWTAACTLPTSTITGTAPCNGSDPVCTQFGTGVLAVKRQSDASWYCFNNSTKNFAGFAACAGTPTPSASPGQTRGPCTKPSNPNAYACTAPLNTCNVTSGTRQAYLDLLDDGSSNCSPQTAPYYPCTAPAPISNCPTPNTCNSSSQCVTPAGSAAPTATPTPTPGANTISVNLAVGLDGIGAVGNLSAANSRSNQNPKTTSRPFQIQIYNEDQNHIIALNTTPVTLTFNSSGRYTGNWTPPVAGGNYKFRIGTYGHLFKLTPAQTITAGQTPTPTIQIDLPAGDLDNNNAVGTNDYALLGNCAFQPATQSGVCQAADLDDTGTIDLSDLNLLRRNFSMSGDN